VASPKRVPAGRRRPLRIVLKYGGHALRSGPDPVLDECAERWNAGDRIVLVHGGGPQIDAELARRGIPEQRVAGLRVTDAGTLETVEAVLCGTVNKALVRALCARGVNAVGVSGEDARLLTARRLVRDGVEFGLVGEITEVHTPLLQLLWRGGYLPVVAPLAVDAQDDTPLNVNADCAAGAIAGALRADLYINVTNVTRVRARSSDPTSEIAFLSAEEVARYIDSGDLTGNIVPKLQSAVEALIRDAHRAFVCGAATAPIAAALTGNGTEIVCRRNA